MDLSCFTKRIALPDAFLVPARLEFEDLIATALCRQDLEDDVRAINMSLALIRETRGGWPSNPVSPDGNYIDLIWHECEFRERKSFSYAVRSAGGDYLGCCYFYPMGSRTPLSSELLECDVDVSWWVKPSAFAAGVYDSLYRALWHWGLKDFAFNRLHFSNLQIPLIEDSAGPHNESNGLRGERH